MYNVPSLFDFILLKIEIPYIHPNLLRKLLVEGG